jgi:hypothetical protein
LAENVRYLIDCVDRDCFDPVVLMECREHLSQTRTALSQPEPEGVELPQAGTVESADAMEQIATETGLEWNCAVGMYLCSVHDLEAIARAVLTRYAHSTIEPVPVRRWGDGQCSRRSQ